MKNLLIETKRLYLTKIKKEDVNDLARLLSDPDVMRYSVKGTCSLEKTESIVFNMLREEEEREISVCSVFEKTTEKWIGIVGLSWEYDEAIVLYRFFKDYWNKGYASEALDGFLKKACEIFTNFQAYAYIEKKNIASLKVAQKVGMKLQKETVFHNKPVLLYKFLDEIFIKEAVESDKDNILLYLKPFVKYSLFLVGNLREKDFSYYYMAIKDSKIIGVAAYFPIFKSFSLFSEDAKVAEKLTTVISKKHDIKALLGISKAAKPSYEKLISLDYKPVEDPENLFMELDLNKFTPFEIEEANIKTVDEKDIDQVAFLHRYLNSKNPSESKVTKEEREKIRLSKIKYCLKVGDTVVSTAMSNGAFLNTFQILGVVTHPDYRGKGFAKAVCSCLIKDIKDKYGAKHAIIFTGKENIIAKRCYELLGFKVTDEYYLAIFI